MLLETDKALSFRRERQCAGTDKPHGIYFAAVLTLLYGISFSYAGEPEKRYPHYPDARQIYGYIRKS